MTKDRGVLPLGMKRSFKNIRDQNRLFEFGTEDKGVLPMPPSDDEKYRYVKRNSLYINLFSIISFVCINISASNFILHNTFLWPLTVTVSFSIIYFIVAFTVNFPTKDFDIERHLKIIRDWKPDRYPTVDIFLPTAGESIEVLRNTWTGVKVMQDYYKGKIAVYSLDDGDSSLASKLAIEFEFNYHVRPDRGYFKKAGNLRHGFKLSHSEFIVIFDADFIPRRDFLNELLPYFDNQKVGIVQSPQYFDVHDGQNWLERGAGAVQEFFYRFSQVSRQQHDASICVGSNAIYRRAALDDIGGTALVEHSEDVHTGFNLRMNGWTIQYVPVLLAKGLCPSTMSAFFKQQYRWCMGSLSLLTSKKFWITKLSWRARLSYISGFLYYIHTALTAFYTPLIPIVLLVLLPNQIRLINYILILPAFIFTQIVIPIWHRSIYGIEAWATRSVYNWAHLFAIWDKIVSKPMSWHPTGTVVKKDRRYIVFRALQIVFNLIPALAWSSIAFYYMLSSNYIDYLPIFISGLYYLLISAKVSSYVTRENHMTIATP